MGRFLCSKDSFGKSAGSFLQVVHAWSTKKTEVEPFEKSHQKERSLGNLEPAVPFDSSRPPFRVFLLDSLPLNLHFSVINWLGIVFLSGTVKKTLLVKGI